MSNNNNNNQIDQDADYDIKVIVDGVEKLSYWNGDGDSIVCDGFPDEDDPFWNTSTGTDITPGDMVSGEQWIAMPCEKVFTSYEDWNNNNYRIPTIDIDNTNHVITIRV